jgi:O-succinylbenzoate synthase
VTHARDVTDVRDALPELDDVLTRAHIVSVPLVTRFRGVEHREAVLLNGPAGWSEFAPFVEYDDAESAPWLAAAIDFGWRTSSAPVLRENIPVNATLPAVPLGEIAKVLSRFGECRTVKVKVAERGETLADDVARVGETRRLLGPARG